MSAGSDTITPIRVLIVDDHRLLAQALEARLGTEPALVLMPSVGDAASATEAIKALRPDVTVVDVELPGIDGIALTASIRKAPSPPAVVVLSAHTDAATAVRAIQAGASAFVTKTSPSADLAAAISAASRGEMWLPPTLLGAVLATLRHEASPSPDRQVLLEVLTPCERQILSLLLAGVPRKTIAVSLDRSENTVRSHIGNMMRKLDVHSAVEMVTAAYKAGLRPDDVEDEPRPRTTSWK